jgi:hypothetical protein
MAAGARAVAASPWAGARPRGPWSGAGAGPDAMIDWGVIAMTAARGRWLMAVPPGPGAGRAAGAQGAGVRERGPERQPGWQPPGGPPGGYTRERGGGWTPGRIASAVAGGLLVLISLGMFGTGGTALWFDTAERTAGYVDLGSASYSTNGYALTSSNVEFHSGGFGFEGAVGTVRLQVTSISGRGPLFAGIAHTADANRYLAGVSHATISGPPSERGSFISHTGGAPAAPPGRAGFWLSHVSGTGTQTLHWRAASGDWTVIAMNAGASRPVSMHVSVAATLPALVWIATGLLIAGAVFLAAGLLLIVIPWRHATAWRTGQRPAGPAR